jgi:hypothetical protein
MSHRSLRLILSTLLLAAALSLAARPAQAHEIPTGAGWLGPLAHQLVQWMNGWSSSVATPSPSARPRVKTECGPEIDPDGRCQAATQRRPRLPVTTDCGGLIDPNGRCQAAIQGRPRPPVTTDCGGLIDPDGRCRAATPRRPRPPVTPDCGPEIDPNGRCLSGSPIHP